MESHSKSDRTVWFGRRIEITPRTMLYAALTVAGCYVAIRLLPVLLVVIAALLLAGTLNPIVNRLEARGMRRGFGIAFVFILGLLTTVFLLALTLPPLVAQVRAVADQEPAIRNQVADYLEGSRATAPLADSLRNVRYDRLAESTLATALTYSPRAFEIVAYSVSAVFLALYIMIDRDRLRGGLFALVPRRFHIRFSRILLNLETIVGGYIRGQLVTSLLLAAFTFTLLTICGVPNAIAIAVFAGVADVIPYFGGILALVPAALAAASRGPTTVAIVIVAMFLYLELEARVVVPRIYGRALRLPSAVVLVALLVGGTLFGIPGALLALPAAAAIRMLIEELRVALPGEEIDDRKIRDRDERAEREYERRARGVPAKKAAEIAVKISDQRRAEEGGPEKAAETPITSGQREH